MSSTTNGSFNSLLDNVNLDQSQDVSSSTVIKSSNDSGDLQINQTKERGQVVDTDDFEYHPMFSSRTYVKVNSVSALKNVLFYYCFISYLIANDNTILF